jgi:AraC family transcriptional regulator, regulatory protein of adaptative response / methylated-DNA-[protein]-cysteine methyltransferase
MKITRQAMWDGVVKRMKTLDGQFVYAVKTTGVFCRPSCPSRRPKKENVEFFPDADSARKTGYRDCARCRPGEAGSSTDMIAEQVREFIENNLSESLTLETIGRAIGSSPFYLQRVFKAKTGMTPRAYAEECRLKAVKKALSDGRQVTEALYEAGYSSASRLYERSSQQLGMTPGTYARGGAGELINYAMSNSPLGRLLMAGTARGICFLQFGSSEPELKRAMFAEFEAATIVQNAEPLSAWINALHDYFAGCGDASAIPVEMSGTVFQQAVWRYLRQIPAGETRTYSDVASAIGQPKAVRAVANACASNKVALAIPCHRVVRQNGSPGGYRWGSKRKQQLIKMEKLEIRNTPGRS